VKQRRVRVLILDCFAKYVVTENKGFMLWYQASYIFEFVFFPDFPGRIMRVCPNNNFDIILLEHLGKLLEINKKLVALWSLPSFKPVFDGGSVLVI